MMMHPLSPFRYTAIGDSITAGAGAFYIYGYAHQYRNLIEKDLKTRVTFRNLAKSGWTSQELLQALRNDPAFFKAIQTADIITCSIGGNDLLQVGRVYEKAKMKKAGKIALQNFQRNFLSIDQTIKNIKKSSTPYSIRYIELYNPLPEFPLAQQLVKKLNQILHKAADSHTKIAPVYAAFLHHENKLLFIDGLHPNYNGHRLIAETIRKLDDKP
ncbi:GDSL-type esterase/lipase family protein [Aneurinibacillus sp. Ricciae_BoGa-3]|uniref:GDSL-type esterase/lipase family protein n=1 Tax=Aneurinibacillus sp. Ricciae_BoGa-3 TaxID=3022697 RepID=UPI0023419B5A|nr:GDSL-type esterase/lipase family protein [Aneurinibacillus sp. Ricciae_BoGa-3]WCK52526.1 GDSL-type esterase/lipase family protein [Aneurinibacillus sp. Ricciae_BoGa-3]